MWNCCRCEEIAPQLALKAAVRAVDKADEGFIDSLKPPRKRRSSYYSLIFDPLLLKASAASNPKKIAAEIPTAADEKPPINAPIIPY